jgi:hypothetical protein
VLWLRKKKTRVLFIAPENHQGPSPVRALVLHLISCIILIFAIFDMKADADAYDLSSGAALVLNLFPVVVSWI